MFIGYPDGVKGCKMCCFDGEVIKILISKDVMFKEDLMYMSDKAESKSDITAKVNMKR